MATLHIVSRAPALESCLRVAAADDPVLLIEQAIDAARHIDARPLLLLQDHCTDAAWLKETSRTNLTTIDYNRFVELVAEHQPVVTWC